MAWIGDTRKHGGLAHSCGLSPVDMDKVEDGL